MADYIKREDIIKWIDDSLELCGDRYSVDQENMMELFRTVINDCLPFADVVERKHGKWKTAYLDHEAFGVRPHTFYCSECHQITSFRTFFCPNCGEDMRGEDDV